MSEKTVIYTITSLYIKNVKNEKKEVIGQKITDRVRLVGFYFDLETAKTCVIEDWGHFDEAGYYNYIVIEKTYDGLYNIKGFDDRLEVWYKDNGKFWEECEKPKFDVSIINFGIG